MKLKRLILDLMLKISKSRYKRDSDIYTTRNSYRSFCKIISLLSHTPKNVQIDSPTIDGIHGLRIIPPIKGAAVIFIIYGGSFVVEYAALKKLYIPFGAELAKAAKAEVWMPEYRIAPDHAYPEQGQNCLASYLSLVGRGVKPRDITIMGFASGASLALPLVLSLRDQGLPLPASVITISAVTDLTLTADSIKSRADRDPMFSADCIQGHFNHYLQGHSPLNPLASPLYGDYKGFPPMYMMVGGNEIFYDDTVLVAAKAKKAGVDVTLEIEEDMIHCYPLWFDILAEGRSAIQRLAAYIENTHMKQENTAETTRSRKSSI